VKYLVYTLPVPRCRHKAKHTDLQCVVQVYIADCFCINCPEMPSLVCHLQDDYDQPIKH
jgi:hypothetical protein